MRASDPDVDADAFCRPNRWRSGFWGVTLLAGGGLFAAAALRDFMPWIEGGALPGGRPMLGLASALVICALGGLLSGNALFALPRLRASAEGVELETLFGTKWANWNSLGAFAVATLYAGPLRRRASFATAPITGASISANLRRKKKFALSDGFTTPIAGIVAELNARRARALGLAPAFAATRPEPEREFGAPGVNIPWLSFLILAVLAAVFVAEQVYAIGPRGPLLRPSLATLQALGGVDRMLVLTQGEWYRLFTAPLLHADFTHILFNGIALVMAGFLLERLVGRAWFFAFFLIGALGGSLMSIALNPADMVSVGASGAIMGLLAAAYVSSFRLPPGSKARWWIQLGAARLLVPALLPLAASGGTHVDYGAHFGGMLSGGLVALLLLRSWPETARLPGFRDVAAGIGVAGLIVIAVSAVATAETFPRYGRLAGLIPENEQPENQREGMKRAAALVARFPDDPRAHFYQGAALEAARDYAGAESELRIALREAEDLRFYLGPKMPSVLRAYLAGVLLEDGRQAEAKETAQPLCTAPPEAAPPAPLRKLLTDHRLCDG